MRKLTPAFYVGLVVLAAAGVFVYLFGSVDKSATSASESYTVTGVLDEVAGLALHSRVTMAGIPVGEIEQIEIDPVSHRKAQVTLRIRNDVALYKGELGPGGALRNSAVLTRRQASLLGDFYLEIAPGIAGAVLQEGEEIPVVISVSGIAAVLEQMERSGDMFSRLDRIAANIEEITQSLATVVGGEKGTMRLERVLEDVAVATDNIAQATTEMREFLRTGLYDKRDDFDRIVGNVETFTGDAARLAKDIDESLKRSLVNVEAFTGEIRGVAERSSGRVDRIVEGVEHGLGRLQASMDTLDQALANVAEISRKVNEGEGTIGHLVNDDRLATGLEEAVDDVGGLVKSISRLQTRVELRLEYGLIEGTTKTYLGLRLQPKPDRWYQFELVDDPRGKTTWLTTVTETNDPSEAPLTRESSVRTSDELKFSLYFAKRFHFLVARAGIIESSGGAGLDLVLLDETVRVAFDAFEFGMDRTPHLKATAQVRLFDHLLLMAGVDDIADDDHRDYFLGLGFTFTDDDLKALLTVAPTPSL